MYPTKNLDDFTIRKAFEIKNLIKEIKGLGLLIWNVHPIKRRSLKIQSDGTFTSINTRTAKGYFLISETTEDKKDTFIIKIKIPCQDGT